MKKPFKYYPASPDIDWEEEEKLYAKGLDYNGDPAFKTGDRVTIKDGSHKYIGTVVDNYCFTIKPYGVNWGNYDGTRYSGAELEHYPKKKDKET